MVKIFLSSLAEVAISVLLVGGLLVALLLYFVYNNLLSLSQTWVAQEKLNPWVGMFFSHVVMLVAVAALFYLRTRQHAPRWRRS